MLKKSETDDLAVLNIRLKDSYMFKIAKSVNKRFFF